MKLPKLFAWIDRDQHLRQRLREEGLVGPPTFLQDLLDWRTAVAGILLLALGASVLWGMIRGTEETRASYEQRRAHPRRRW